VASDSTDIDIIDDLGILNWLTVEEFQKRITPINPRNYFQKIVKDKNTRTIKLNAALEYAKKVVDMNYQD
jgi:hypothetical protein